MLYTFFSTLSTHTVGRESAEFLLSSLGRFSTATQTLTTPYLPTRLYKILCLNHSRAYSCSPLNLAAVMEFETCSCDFGRPRRLSLGRDEGPAPVSDDDPAPAPTDDEEVPVLLVLVLADDE